MKLGTDMINVDLFFLHIIDAITVWFDQSNRPRNICAKLIIWSKDEEYLTNFDKIRLDLYIFVGDKFGGDVIFFYATRGSSPITARLQ